MICQNFAPPLLENLWEPLPQQKGGLGINNVSGGKKNKLLWKVKLIVQIRKKLIQQLAIRVYYGSSLKLIITQVITSCLYNCFRGN